MLRYLYIIFFLCFPHIVSGQDKDNYLQIQSNTGWNFVCNSPTTLENDQVITNAFTLRVKSKNKNCLIYCRMSSYNVPNGASIVNNPVMIDWTSDDANQVSNLVTQPLNIKQVDQLLFSMSKSNQVSSFYYDLRLQAPGYEYVPGNYNFTLLFTMTQP